MDVKITDLINLIISTIINSKSVLIITIMFIIVAKQAISRIIIMRAGFIIISIIVTFTVTIIIAKLKFIQFIVKVNLSIFIWL